MTRESLEPCMNPTHAACRACGTCHLHINTIRRVRQGGVAVVTALLLASLAVTIVANLFWQQQVQVRSVENQRLQLQKQWVLRGAMDWAQLILREDARNSAIDDLSEPWATPLAPTRIDRYVEAAAISSDKASAELSGLIQDAQGRFNLTNLSTRGSINAGEVQVLARLLVLLRLDPALASLIAEQFAMAERATLSPKTDAVRPISFIHLDDLLAIPGCTLLMVNALRPHIVILPKATPVNINTASAEVLAARVPGLSLEDARLLINSRRQAAFRNWTDMAARLPDRNLVVDAGRVSVNSGYFVVDGKVMVRNATLQMQALVERQPNATRLLWVREL